MFTIVSVNYKCKNYILDLSTNLNVNLIGNTFHVSKNKLLQESYVLVYELLVLFREWIAVEYIRVDRTGINAYSIRIKL